VDRAFLEREGEMSVLAALADEVERSGTGAIALVEGEAGVGKTTLARRFAATRPRVLWGVCDPLATPAPLGPVVEIAAQLDGAAARVLEGAAKPYEVGQALLADLAASPGALAVVEDLHWSDEGTLDVLVHVGRRLDRVPVLLLVTHRPSESLRAPLGILAAAAQVRRLQPAPLSRKAVLTLAEASGRDGDAVFATTSGNPFFVSEVLASAPGDVPANVRDAVLGRVAQLDDEARAVVELVSVVPPAAESWLVGDAPVSPLLERRGDVVAFRHELARLAVEQSLPDERRVALHRHVLAGLAARGAEAARLAHHAAGAHDRDALLLHATAAGERSAALGAHREAAAQYALALSVERSAELLSGYAYECYLTDRLEEAIAAQEEAVERSPDGDMLRLLSRFYWFGGRNADAEATARAAVDASPEGVHLARAYSNLAQLRLLAYECEPAIELGRRALELADDEVAVHALTNIGSAQVLAGSEAEGRATLEESLRRALALGLEDDAGRGYANLASTAVERRQFALADRYLADGIPYCDEHDLLSYGVYLRAWRARVALDGGRWRAARELVDEVLAQSGAAPPTRIVAHVVAALLAVRTGDAARGGELLAVARAAAEPTGELQRLAPVASAEAEAAWLRGDAAGVDAATAAVADLAAARRQPWPLGDLAVWQRRAGLPAPEGEVSPPAAAELAGDHAAAAALWSDLGCPYEAALALAGAGDEASLRRAHAELQRLGAVPAAKLVARRLRDRGVRDLPRGPYRAARSNESGLTARELEILTLLAEPLRNAEIAQRLVLSTRTVDHHVSRILAKLGARDRVEAAAAARRLGIAKDR
jgi:DNA-binding CsgD family transcriptional regulator/tetratricopeptide (TPR) repeat protein